MQEKGVIHTGKTELKRHVGKMATGKAPKKKKRKPMTMADMQRY